MAQVKWMPCALDDVDGIADHIAKDSPKYASVLVRRFFDRADVLERYPMSGHVVSEVGSKELRELTEGNYRIIYWLGLPDQVPSWWYATPNGC